MSSLAGPRRAKAAAVLLSLVVAVAQSSRLRARRPPWNSAARLPGVSEGRAGQMRAGAIVADAVMDLMGLGQLQICPWALREGVILKRLDVLSDPATRT